jgi:sulfur-oxidizing protein SoxZ
LRRLTGEAMRRPRRGNGTTESAMADPMKIRANLMGDSTEVKVLMNHEMETGQRKDAQGKTIPAWFIQNVKVTHNDKVVLNAQWGPAVAKNPFVSFKFKGGAKGDKVKITWVDNRIDTRTDEATIA